MASTSEKMQLVTFQIGSEHYGMNIMDVLEIQNLSEVRPVPHAPSYVEGIFNLRGEIVPIINLHKRFHIMSKVNNDEETLSGFVIFKANDMKLGVIIDRIQRVVQIDDNEIHMPPQLVTGVGAEYIQGVVNIRQDDDIENGGHYLIILDVVRLFDAKEIAKLQSLQQSLRNINLANL
jgi:purine-binding chemotaxis protein CheW